MVESDAVEGLSSFQQLASSKKRKYVMISGKGGVGKTSLAASLACQLAAGELPATFIFISTDLLLIITNQSPFYI